MSSYTLNFVLTYILFLSHNNEEKQEELQHDLQSAIPKLEEWKSHIVWSVHQDASKTAAVDTLSHSSVFLIMN